MEKDYSLDAFNRFFDYAASKELLKRNTAQSRKAAINKILENFEQSELTDLRELDIDQAFNRFENISGTQYKPDSLQVYLSRARTALIDFIAYVDSPSSFKPASAQRSVAKQKNEAKNNTNNNKISEKQRDTSNSENEIIDHLEIKHIIVPIPIRENLTVKIINLPVDLTQAEAERLAAIVKAYAVPTVK